MVMNNYDRIIIEMLSRIQSLEERVEKLESMDERYMKSESTEFTDELSVDDKDSSTKISPRRQALEYIMDKLSTPPYSLSVRKAKRAEGGGIVIARNGKSYNVKISYSRSYDQLTNKNILCAGWHGLYESEIMNPAMNYYIFIVSDSSLAYHCFIFKRSEFLNVFKDKSYDPNRQMHFYFGVNKDGTSFENRENDKDMSEFYNNWDKFLIP